MIMVQGRILDPPQILYRDKTQGKDQVEDSVNPNRASWDMISKKFRKPGEVGKWAVLALGGASYTQNHIESFRSALHRGGMAVGPAASAYTLRLVHNVRDDHALIEKMIQKVKSDGVQCLFVVLPSKSATNYSSVKRWADLSAGRSPSPGCFEVLNSLD